MPASRRSRLRAWVAALRPHQWTKNLLVFVALLAAHRVTDVPAWQHAAIAFVAFCLCASSAYLVNDVLDRDADRMHPRKRLRPFASGELAAGAGVAAAALLATLAFATALWPGLPAPFLPMLALYAATTLAYSLWIKRIVVLDVLTLAGLYTLRIIAGAIAVPVPVSGWFLAFAMAVFLSLALVKRYVEVDRFIGKPGDRIAGRGYVVAHRATIRTAGIACAAIAVGVLAAYVVAAPKGALYANPAVLWINVGLFALWMHGLWRAAWMRAMHDDPLIHAMTDRSSLMILALSVVAVVWATLG